jgi:hypothetical protein
VIGHLWYAVRQVEQVRYPSDELLLSLPVPPHSREK